MAGYAARTGGAVGTHDDLHVRAAIVSGERRSLCLLSADVLHLDAALVGEIRSDIAARLRVDPVAIMVAATHTHSGPAGLARVSPLPGAERYLGAYDAGLAQRFRARCVEAAAAAAAAAIPVWTVIGRGSARGVAGNRLERGGIVDPDVPWLAFVDRAGTIHACILSFPCHPTVLGSDNRFYSADLAGALCRRLEGAHNVGCALCLTGAAGNISTRFTRQASSFDEVERLAAQVIDTFNFETAQPDQETACDYASTTITLALKPRDLEGTRARLEEVERLLNTSAEPERRAALLAEKLGLELALRPGGTANKTVTTELQVLCIGRSLIVCFPAEMFVEYGLALREHLPHAHVLIAGYANDYIGYVPTPEANSSYETAMAIVAPTAGEHLFDGALQLARSMLVQP
jgi:neutral ceramidase